VKRTPVRDSCFSFECGCYSMHTNKALLSCVGVFQVDLCPCIFSKVCVCVCVCVCVLGYITS